MAAPLANSGSQCKAGNGDLHSRLALGNGAESGESACTDKNACPGPDSWVEDGEVEQHDTGTGGTGPAGLLDPENRALSALQEELNALRADNDQLRATVIELEQALAESAQKTSESWEERQKEYESLIDEKSEVIRSLHVKMQEMQDRPAGATPREEEILALSEELEGERRQLKDDEETLMQQMREMEIQMSRERAEMARQRTELVRLQNEIQHELAMAERDGTLRDRLAPLQRRHQDLVSRRGAAPAAVTEPASPAAAPPAANGGLPGRDAGFFRRLFK